MYFPYLESPYGGTFLRTAVRPPVGVFRLMSVRPSDGRNFGRIIRRLENLPVPDYRLSFVLSGGRKIRCPSLTPSEGFSRHTAIGLSGFPNHRTVNSPANKSLFFHIRTMFSRGGCLCPTLSDLFDIQRIKLPRNFAA